MEGKLVKAYRYLFSRDRDADADTGKSTDSKLGFMVPGKGIGGTAIKPLDFRKQVEANIGTIYSCVDLRATAVASATLRFYVGKDSKSRTFEHTITREVSKRRKDYLFSLTSNQVVLRSAVDLEEVVDHPIIDLLTNVNNLHNGYDLKNLLEIFLGLTGNCYWYLPRGDALINRPAEIWTIPSQFMSITSSEEKLVTGYVYRRGMKKIHYSVDEIIHFKYPGPNSLLYGQSPLAAISAEYNLQNSMNTFDQKTAGKMGVPPVALKVVEGQILHGDRDDKIEEVQNMWVESFGDKPPPVMDGYEIVDFAHSPRDLNFTQGRRWTKEQISNAYKVPISLLKTESVNRANAEAGEYQFAKYCILGEVTRIAQELNQSLCPMYDDNLFCAFDNPVPLDRERERQELETHLKTGFMTINEKRAKDGLEPVPWGDEPFAIPTGGFATAIGGSSHSTE